MNFTAKVGNLHLRIDRSVEHVDSRFDHEIDRPFPDRLVDLLTPGARPEPYGVNRPGVPRRIRSDHRHLEVIGVASDPAMLDRPHPFHQHLRLGVAMTEGGKLTHPLEFIETPDLSK